MMRLGNSAGRSLQISQQVATSLSIINKEYFLFFPTCIYVNFDFPYCKILVDECSLCLTDLANQLKQISILLHLLLFQCSFLQEEFSQQNRLNLKLQWKRQKGAIWKRLKQVSLQSYLCIYFELREMVVQSFTCCSRLDTGLGKRSLSIDYNSGPKTIEEFYNVVKKQQ